jgi:hypothetical protein
MGTSATRYRRRSWTSAFSWGGVTSAAGTPIDSILKQKSQTVAKKLKLKMIFKKSAGRVQNSPHTAFSAIIGEVSCLFSLALEFSTRFRGRSFQPLTHLSEHQLSVASKGS